jgi:hypothetical protein
MKKKISILTPTISENAMGRAYLIAKLLQPKYSVTIVGNGSIENIWRPVKNDKTINYKLFKCDSVVDLFLKANCYHREKTDPPTTGFLIHPK